MSRPVTMSSFRTGKADILVRSALREDSPEIARLFMLSSEGMAAYIWDRHRQPGETVQEAGARRYARDDVDFSWQNCLMAEHRGRIVGMIHSYPMQRSRSEKRSQPDPVLAPYAELEAEDTLYVSSLAIDSDFRNLGIGGFLLDLAWENCRNSQLQGLSLICMEGNDGAMRLYRRYGFTEQMRAAIVPHPMLVHQHGDAVLMVKPAH